MGKNNDIKQILNEATDGVLDEGTLDQIEKVFNNKVNSKAELKVESALAEQDELYASKLEELIETIDNDHTKKLKRVVESLDDDRAKKLELVVRKYERSINDDAEQFKQTLVESISDFIELYIDNKLPNDEIQEAVQNTKARNVLKNLRSSLAVDSILERESIKEAVEDGHNQINEANSKLESVIKENRVLKESLNKANSKLILEQKCEKLDNRTRSYVRKVLSDKDPDFIKENFDYTVNLFRKKDNDRLDMLKEEAYKDTKRVDRVVHHDEELIDESTHSPLSPYLEELGKY